MSTRPKNLAEFLEKYPTPWQVVKISPISGAQEYDIQAANGQLVPNHGPNFFPREYAEIFAELGNAHTAAPAAQTTEND